VAPPCTPFHAKDPGAAGSGGGAGRRRRDGGPPPVPAATQGHALFLDVDGTLLELAHHPGAVEVSAELVTLLRRLGGELDGALALISGRSLEDLDRLFTPLVLPAAGVHGLERRGADGIVHHAAAADLLDGLRRPLQSFAGVHKGLLVEDKGRSLALHYRAAPALAGEAEAFLEDLVGKHGAALQLKRGKMVFEVQPGGADKGTAITDFMAEAPFGGRRPVFIGDDVTDEDGFAAVNRLGGLSIRVGDGAASAAAYCLADEPSVFAWLHAWLGDRPERETR